MVVPGIQRVTPLKEITVSDKWNGVRCVPVSLITLLSATVALGMAACTSDESPTEPSAGAGMARAALGTYTAVDLGTAGEFSEARGINPAGQVVGLRARVVEENGNTTLEDARAFLWERGIMTDLGTLGGDFSEAA